MHLIKLFAYMNRNWRWFRTLMQSRLLLYYYITSFLSVYLFGVVQCTYFAHPLLPLTFLVMFLICLNHKLVCGLSSMKLKLIEGASLYYCCCCWFFFFTKYSHATWCWHHLTPSFFTVANHSLKCVISEEARKINSGKARQAALISMKCTVTVQNWKQIRNVVLWFCRLWLPRVAFSLPSTLLRLTRPLMSRPSVRPVALPPSLPPTPPLQLPVLSRINVLLGGFF